jgi:hypothetical protein
MNMDSDIISVADQLEALIDKYGLQHILTGLELVCGEKADHIRSNWQDNATARSWDAKSRQLGNLARHPVLMAHDRQYSRRL